MQENNMIDLLGSLKEMSSEQLSQLIQEETAKESPNDDLVLMALDILEDREKENPVQLGTKGTVAWKKYQLKVHSRQRKRILIWKPIMQVASVLVAITLLFALLPTQANAETWWERLARWSDDFFSFFNPNESEMTEDVYIFQTDNEGLQQVYDKVVELGITEPVVPMWLPDGYELKELKSFADMNQKVIVTSFSNGFNEFVFQISLHDMEVSYEYYKDETRVREIEEYGFVFYVFQNNERNTITWTNDKVECAFSIECQEDVLYEIIESIYRWR